jgi:beta-galactosidase
MLWATAVGSFADYYAAFEQHHGLQGGFIWEWLDHGIRMYTPAGEPYWVYGGSFGELPHDGNFVADGMVWPDRTPHPAMREFMYLARPVRITAIDSANGVFSIENRRFYTTLADLHGTWRIVVNGTVTHTGTITIPSIAPQSTGTITLPVQWPANGESFIEFTFVTTTDSYWAPAGHVVAWDRIVGSIAQPAPTMPSATHTVSSITQTHLILTNNHYRVVVDRTTGTLSDFNQRQAIIAWPQLNLWRAPTDNDHLQEMFAMMRLQAYPLWRSVGFTQLQYRVSAVHAIVTAAGTHAIEVRTCASGRERWDDVQTTHTYTLTDTGSVRISTHVVLAPDLVDLPRIGITLQLDPAFETIAWYGRGSPRKLQRSQR